MPSVACPQNTVCVVRLGRRQCLGGVLWCCDVVTKFLGRNGGELHLLVGAELAGKGTFIEPEDGFSETRVIRLGSIQSVYEYSANFYLASFALQAQAVLYRAVVLYRDSADSGAVPFHASRVKEYVLAMFPIRCPRCCDES